MNKSRPDTAAPMCVSISITFWTDAGSNNGDVNLFSIAIINISWVIVFTKNE